MEYSKGEKVYCFPQMGIYTDMFMEFFRDLGLNAMKPPEISARTIKLGVKYSPDMICYPFKVTLGNFIECLEADATDLIMYNSCGTCRYRQYYIIQDLIMKDLNYKFTMHQLRPRQLLKDLKKLNPENSYLKIIRVIRKHWKKIKELEDAYHGEIDPNDINIGVVGEIFTVLEPRVNMQVVAKLKKGGVKVHSYVNVRHLITDSFGFNKFKKNENFKAARMYLDGGTLGGHGVENIRDTIYFVKSKIDGIVHLLPLSCMPETTIEPVLNKICYEANIPILRLSIDETNSELNMETRLETFVELIKRKKQHLKAKA